MANFQEISDDSEIVVDSAQLKSDVELAEGTAKLEDFIKTSADDIVNGRNEGGINVIEGHYEVKH